MYDNQKAKVRQMLVNDEGYRQFPYKCTAGKLSIGIGRNLQDRGISKDEAYFLLNTDIDYFAEFLEQKLPFFNELTENRQNVLINMCFNLGTTGFMKFRKMLEHVKNHDYEKAVLEMRRSKWVSQVPNRAKRLCDMMLEG
jgi:lysozyme